jgi:hypothetical protein
MSVVSVITATGSASHILSTKQQVISGFVPWIRKSPVYTTVPRDALIMKPYALGT